MLNIRPLDQSINRMDSVDLSASPTALPTSHATHLLSESPLVGHSNHFDPSSSNLLSVHNPPWGDCSQSHDIGEEHDEEDKVEEDLQEADDEELQNDPPLSTPGRPAVTAG